MFELVSGALYPFSLEALLLRDTTSTDSAIEESALSREQYSAEQLVLKALLLGEHLTT